MQWKWSFLSLVAVGECIYCSCLAYEMGDKGFQTVWGIVVWEGGGGTHNIICLEI